MQGFHLETGTGQRFFFSTRLYIPRKMYCTLMKPPASSKIKCRHEDRRPQVFWDDVYHSFVWRRPGQVLAYVFQICKEYFCTALGLKQNFVSHGCKRSTAVSNGLALTFENTRDSLALGTPSQVCLLRQLWHHVRRRGQAPRFWE